MIQEFLKAFGLIFMAEMGDKTQILAMAFATQYAIRKVVVGISIGVFLNHGVAVLIGALLSTIIDIQLMQSFAGFAFIGFALWTLKIDVDDHDNQEKKNKFGPIVTIAIAFFIGELGDKTQLTAITLAADAVYPVLILAGTVSGMIATSSFGIFVGKKLGDKIPELAIKYLAAAVFLIFGFQKLWISLPNEFLRFEVILMFASIIGILSSYLAYKLYQQQRLGLSQFKQASKKLYDYYQHISRHLDEICMGENYCKACLGDKCAIGQAKLLVQAGLDHPGQEMANEIQQSDYVQKPFNEDDVLHALVDTLRVIESVQDEKRLQNAHMIRRQLEIVLLHKVIFNYDDISGYFRSLKLADDRIGQKCEDLWLMSIESI